MIQPLIIESHMNKYLAILISFTLVACVKNRPPEKEDQWADERVHIDMICSDSGTTWKVNKIEVFQDRWNPDSSRYYEFFRDSSKPSAQQLICKSEGPDSGTIVTTDSIAWLLRTSLQVPYRIADQKHTHMLLLNLQPPSRPLQVGFRKERQNGVIKAGAFQLHAMYTEGDILSIVILSLSP
jgi:hypothetical protein